jgi:hypothetical protein
MKRVVPLAAVSLLVLVWRPAQPQTDPCHDYGRALAYARSADPEPVHLTLEAERTGAAIELRIPRNYTAIWGNQTSGLQCRIALELMWPELTPGGIVPDSQKRVRDRMMGDTQVWRALTLDIEVERKAWAAWMTPTAYCAARRRRAELPERPFGLRAFDDGRAWPRHRQRDGSYRSVRELLPYPLDRANGFYFVDGDAQDMISISCSKGAPRCQLHDHVGELRTITLNQQRRS